MTYRTGELKQNLKTILLLCYKKYFKLPVMESNKIFILVDDYFIFISGA